LSCPAFSVFIATGKVVKIRPSSFIPLAISGAIVVLGCIIHDLARKTFLRDSKAILGLPEYVEALTYDSRVQLAARMLDPHSVAPDLATLLFDDIAFDRVNSPEYSKYLASVTNLLQATKPEFRPTWPWPRYLHGQIVREIAAEGATAIGFDVLFPEEKNDPPVPLPDGEIVSSDEFFAREIQKAGNVALGVQNRVLPYEPFMRNAAWLANISRDEGAVVRRMKAFDEVRIFHPLITAYRKSMNLDLDRADVSDKMKIVIRCNPSSEETNPPPFVVTLNANGTLKLNLDRELNLGDDPAGPATEKPFEIRRVWNLGLVLAAKILELDLDKARVTASEIVIPGAHGISRTIPVDPNGYFYVDWSITYDAIKSNKTPIYFGHITELLIRDFGRTRQHDDGGSPYRRKAVLIGSVASGNNVSDYGETPLERRTPLVTAHLNIANSVITGRFIQRSSLLVELLVIALLGMTAGLVAGRSDVGIALGSIAALAVAYIVIATWLYVHDRYWIPIFMPMAGGLLFPVMGVQGYRVFFEEKEKRRVRGIFSKMVSPEIVKELLAAEKLSLKGKRRRITVFFADVRGFTELTDAAQSIAEDYITQKNIMGVEAEKIYDKQSADILETVNLYLRTISDIIYKHQGTFDKYIGDCVMAFWGDPKPDDKHAVKCVQAAIEAQRTLNELNRERAAENEWRASENTARAAGGKDPLPLLPLLSLGTGINTGYAIMGLMGSDEICNYTAFGREVNLASRLEGISGRGRILITQATFEELKSNDPALAATVVALEAVPVKGFRQPVKIFEVPWRTAEESRPPETKAKVPASVKPVTVGR
jgi:class 3 adenylate cyclase/CHASE2 domain-containing sensor protein